jgi:hypothetical protein
MYVLGVFHKFRNQNSCGEVRSTGARYLGMYACARHMRGRKITEVNGENGLSWMIRLRRPLEH